MQRLAVRPPGTAQRDVRAVFAAGARSGTRAAAAARDGATSRELARCVAARANAAEARGTSRLARKVESIEPPEPTLPPPEPETVKTWTYELTFDDGPHVAKLGTGENRTEKVLDTLKAKGIKAGFFIQTGVSHRGAADVGKALVKRMHDEGHTVAVHTGGKADHELHTKAQKEHRLKGELRSAKAYIRGITGEEPRYVRPPTGAYNPAVSATYARVGLTNLMWDIDGDAGQDHDLATLKRRFSTQLALLAHFGKTLPNREGITVLYHDIQKGTSENLAAIIEHIKEATETLSTAPILPTLTPPPRSRNVAAFRAP